MGLRAVDRVTRGVIAAIVCVGLASPSATALAQHRGDDLPDPDSLSAEEKLEWAKKLYLEAKEFHDNEDYYNSVIKYEQAYSYAPDKHIFAYNLGIDAWELRDCARVKQYLLVFLVKDDDNLELQKEARAILREAEGNSECITGGPGKPAETPAETSEETPEETSEETPEEEENPLEIGGPPPEVETSTAGGGPSPMLIGGAVLTVLGAGALAGGIGTTVVGSKAAHELYDLSRPGETGFTPQPYNQAVIDLERRLSAMNVVSPILITLGGAMLAGGVALLVVDSSNRKNGRGHYAARRAPRVTAFGVTPTRRGAAASLTLRF